jgi:hypothetical protein
MRAICFKPGKLRVLFTMTLEVSTYRIPPAALGPVVVSTSNIMSTRNLAECKVRTALKVDNLTAIYDQIVQKYGSPDVSQPYRPPGPVTKMTLP